MTGAAALLRHLSPGERVFLPGSAGEAIPLIAALSDGNAPPLDIVASFVPGLNPLPLDRFAPGTIVTSMFAAPGIGAAQAERRFRHLPLSYAGFAAWLTTTPAFDVCVAHVAPPDAQGNCSLGPAVEFTSVALRGARRARGFDLCFAKIRQGRQPGRGQTMERPPVALAGLSGGWFGASRFDRCRQWIPIDRVFSGTSFFRAARLAFAGLPPRVHRRGDKADSREILAAANHPRLDLAHAVAFVEPHIDIAAARGAFARLRRAHRRRIEEGKRQESDSSERADCR